MLWFIYFTTACVTLYESNLDEKQNYFLPDYKRQKFDKKESAGIPSGLSSNAFENTEESLKEENHQQVVIYTCVFQRQVSTSKIQ